MLTAAAAYRSSAAAAATRRFAVARPPAATDARQRIAALTLSRPTRIRNASTRAYIAPISHAFATDSLFPYEAEPTNQQQHRHAPSQILSTSPAKPSASILRRIAQNLKRWARSILDALWVAARATEIGVILSPLLVLTPASVLTVRLLDTSKVSDMSWWYTLHSLQLLGPAFVKLAQWAATRRDLFPPHICNRLSRLHDNAQIHSWKHTDETLTKAFGNYEEKGLQMDPNDIIGSGSAAQVYRAKLAGQTVAIKVLHPKISERVDRDLMLMRRVASLLDSVPIEMIRMLSLPRAADNFASVLSKQVDLRIEGKNLSRFHENFTYQKKSLLKAFMSTNIPSARLLVPARSSVTTKRRSNPGKVIPRRPTSLSQLRRLLREPQRTLDLSLPPVASAAMSKTRSISVSSWDPPVRTMQASKASQMPSIRVLFDATKVEKQPVSYTHLTLPTILRV